MSYPYPRLFLDIRLAKKRLEKVLGPARGVADGTSDGPRLAEICPTGARLTELFYAVSKQEAARAVFCGVAIERIRPTVGRSIVAKANSPGEVGTNVPVKEFQMLLG
jgi:hypothetical protein